MIEGYCIVSYYVYVYVGITKPRRRGGEGERGRGGVSKLLIYKILHSNV